MIESGKDRVFEEVGLQFRVESPGGNRQRSMMKLMFYDLE